MMSGTTLTISSSSSEEVCISLSSSFSPPAASRRRRPVKNQGTGSEEARGGEEEEEADEKKEKRKRTNIQEWERKKVRHWGKEAGGGKRGKASAKEADIRMCPNAGLHYFVLLSLNLVGIVPVK